MLTFYFESGERQVALGKNFPEKGVGTAYQVWGCVHVMRGKRRSRRPLAGFKTKVVLPEGVTFVQLKEAIAAAAAKMLAVKVKVIAQKVRIE